jgi:hypothetical protein
MVAKSLFLFFDHHRFSQSPRFLRLRNDSLNTVIALIDSKQRDGLLVDGSDKKQRLARETVAHWLLACVLGGDSGVHQWWHLSLLPPLFNGLLDEDIEQQNFMRAVIKFMSQGVNKSFDDSTISTLTQHSSWKVREESVRYIGVVETRLSPTSQEIIRSLFPLLGDVRTEVGLAVRDVASLVFMSDLGLPHGSKIVDQLMLSANKQLKHIKRSKGTSQNELISKNITAIRYGVNGLCALILSAPFDVPPSVVPAIAVLARLASSCGDETKTAIRHAFMEFKRTHLDNWDVHRMCFDEHTLDAFNETFEAPSYFC